jgi:D-tyrosyl-tRNA(Tyr) deacylase
MLMRAVIQRVTSASVRTTNGAFVEIDAGLLVLLGIGRDDAPDDCTWLAEKVVDLRLFPDDAGQMNCSVSEINGEILVVSQFTLYASVRKGTRPSFNDAAKSDAARPLYEEFILQLQTALGRRVETGTFGASMKVTLVNDGPVTIIIDTKARD